MGAVTDACGVLRDVPPGAAAVRAATDACGALEEAALDSCSGLDDVGAVGVVTCVPLFVRPLCVRCREVGLRVIFTPPMVMLCIVTDDGGGVGANDTRGGETVGVEAKIFGGRWHSI